VRRRIFVAALSLFAIATASASWAFELDTPEGQLQAYRRIQCSVNDGEVVVYWWLGNVFARVPGEPDRKIFRVEGMNIRHCGTVEDPVKGTGFRLVTRELLFYMDPESGEILRQWENPWTGEPNQVLHVANDPVNQPAVFAVGRSGGPFQLPFEFRGDHWWLTSAVPLFYKNPLGGDYQEYVGGTYHATEMFNFMGDVASLTDDDINTADVGVGWVRLSSWLPWMEMGDRPGILYFHTAGRKLASYDEISEPMKAEIVKNYPLYTEPPPLNDTRRNETSWTYFRKMIESGEFGD
jgi:hypothetical protein